MRVEAWCSGTSASMRRDARELAWSFCALEPGKSHMSTQPGASICQPGKELSPKTDHAGILILNFQPPQLQEMHFYCLSNPSTVFCQATLVDIMALKVHLPKLPEQVAERVLLQANLVKSHLGQLLKCRCLGLTSFIQSASLEMQSQSLHHIICCCAWKA